MSGLTTDVPARAPQHDVDLRARAEELLESHPPATTAPSDFWAAQFDAGLAWVEFAPGSGGLGAAVAAQQVVDERLREAGAPRNEPVNLIGIAMMAPTMVAFGTPGQRERFLRPAFACEEIWCQLFSEPGAGSDLASLTTRADRDGDDWLVTGQKVWTTMAHRARWGLLLARTDPSVPKHAGLTYFVVDMHAPGVEVRPLRQITGEAEYNEVFLTDVRVPDAHRLGPTGAGWKVAMSTLTSERLAVGPGIGSTRGSGPIAQAVELWGRLGTAERSPVLRDRMARCWIEAEVLRLTMERAEHSRRDGRPGPEGSIAKVGFGLVGQAVAALCMEISGPDALLIDHYDMVRPERFTHTGDDLAVAAPPAKVFLAAQALTIAGGTTNVNKNVLAERVLGLPPEPRPRPTEESPS
jgi:alkylation response protein AidB-like acyl-CoA dehydrogenase